MSADPLERTSTRVSLPGVTLDVVQSGAGSMILFLHGFPERGRAWYRIAAKLSDHHHCVVPDQRGYGASEWPRKQEAYEIDVLLGDVDALVEHFAPARLTLVGHDWGGLLAWWFASRKPDRVDRLIVVNAPHPAVFQRALLHDPEQRQASAYIARFREPGAELRLMPDGPEAFWDETFGRLGDALTAQDRACYIAAWSQPGAVRAMLAWYRAAPFRLEGETPGWVDEVAVISSPTLVLWGLRDTALLPRLLDPLPELVSNLRIVRFDNAGHSLIHQEPDTVAAHIRSFAA